MNKSMVIRGLTLPIILFALYLIVFGLILPLTKLETWTDLFGLLAVFYMPLAACVLGGYLIYQVYLIWKNRTTEIARRLSIGYAFIGSSLYTLVSDRIIGHLHITVAVVFWGILFYLCWHMLNYLLKESNSSHITMSQIKVYYIILSIFMYGDVGIYLHSRLDEMELLISLYALGYPILMYGIYKLIINRYFSRSGGAICKPK